MRIIIITQNDPFYLPENIARLLAIICQRWEVAGCLVFDASPFGGDESTSRKVLKTIGVFGPLFFVRYSIRLLINRISSSRSIRDILKEHEIPEIAISGSINTPETIKNIKSCQPDLLVSIAGNQIFKKRLIDIAPMGCLNLHTALLPKYRGLIPSFWVLKNDERYTGVSVFLVDEGIDSGPILVQKRIEIGCMTQEQLILHTKKIGMDAIIEAIGLIEEGNYKIIENDDRESSYYSFPTRKDVREFHFKGKRFF